ncbi:MAG: hypothetical protein IJ680_05040, partial [Paludibacteraceae bacterium]|nr:hypothetical protein [Paludibacteraceae bacterium]
IAGLEAQISLMEQQLAEPEHAADADLFQQYGIRKHEVEQKMYEWELLGEQLEQLRTQLQN